MRLSHGLTGTGTRPGAERPDRAVGKAIGQRYMRVAHAIGGSMHLAHGSSRFGAIGGPWAGPRARGDGRSGGGKRRRFGQPAGLVLAIPSRRVRAGVRPGFSSAAAAGSPDRPSRANAATTSSEDSGML